MAVCFISLRQVPRFQSCYLIQPSTPPLRNGHTHTETLTDTQTFEIPGTEIPDRIFTFVVPVINRNPRIFMRRKHSTRS
jgi:hypothetical protein